MLWLEQDGHKIRHFESASSLFKEITKDRYDLLILDWVLPDKSGIEVLRWVRENLDWHIPVLFTTQREAEEDIVCALENGADDYMVKPLKMMEMLARIKVLGNRSTSHDSEKKKLEASPYTLDPVNRSISIKGDPVEMTHKEFDLALFLFRNTGRILSRGHILETVWGRNPDVNTRTVDTHVSRLRNKLKFNQEEGWRLSTIYQHGYRLERLNQT
jgi:DNA-binding response OmpR family regulator